MVKIHLEELDGFESFLLFLFDPLMSLSFH